MRKVINDLYERNVCVDDVNEIYALKYEGADTDEDALKIIFNLGKTSPKIIKTKVNLLDERPEGTHGYKGYLMNRKEFNTAIWEGFI